MQHEFTTSEGNDKYYKVIFCRKCGLVTWFFNWSPEKNVSELQSKTDSPCSSGKERESGLSANKGKR